MKRSKWQELKQRGSKHYRSDGVQPIDLYKDGGMFRDFALASIIKYAYRNRTRQTETINPNDLDKIIHYAEFIKADAEDKA